MSVSGLRKLQEWFTSGTLLRPRSCRYGLVDFSRALAVHCGVEHRDLAAPARELKRELFDGADHVVLVLVDGLGAAQIERDLPGGFLCRHCKRTLQTVFPSSTAPAITSLVTGKYPSTHAVPTWWVHLLEYDVTAELLPFIDRYERQPLEKIGATAADIFPESSMLADYVTPPCTVTRAPYVDTVFSTYSRGGTTAVGYTEFEHGVEQVVAHVDSRRAQGSPSYTYWYLPQYDQLCHEAGLQRADVLELLQTIEKAIEDLARRLNGKARLFMTADHGHVDVPSSRLEVIGSDDPIMQFLTSPPSGEPSVPVFFVASGCEQDFEAAFEARWGHWFALLSIDEVDQLELFGPGRLSPMTRTRLGSYIAVSSEPTALYHGSADEDQFLFGGVHGGLSRAESIVPLVVVQ